MSRCSPRQGMTRLVIIAFFMSGMLLAAETTIAQAQTHTYCGPPYFSQRYHACVQLCRLYRGRVFVRERVRFLPVVVCGSERRIRRM